MNNLIWFNKEGDAVNIVPDLNNNIYYGTLNFDANSSDTFKTLGLYLFEKVNSINLDSIDDDIKLDKFQLFNENRITITGNTFFTQSVTSINTVNNRQDFNSKWIYGEHFESKFPIGTSIKFDKPIFEFTNLNTTYTVVATKKNAIMIITPTTNKAYNTLYGGLTFSDLSISGVNSIGIYDYRRGFIEQLSDWNEQYFYTKLYNNKKINIINSGLSSSNFIVTVKNKDYVDRVYNQYYIDDSSYTQSIDLSALLTIKTELPLIYNDGINIVNDVDRFKLFFSNKIPIILKPGIQFTINNSVFNTLPITIGSIPLFTSNVNSLYYATQSQVIWNNLIYQCVQSYYYTPTSSITPDNNSYWTSSITYLPSYDYLTEENILNADAHLVTNKFNFKQSFTISNKSTMAAFAQNNSDAFKIFNVDLSYNDGVLNSKLLYSSEYAEVDYLIGTQSLTKKVNVFENVFETFETLAQDINLNISNNFSYNIVITDIDDFGIKITINDFVYTESVEYVYNGLNIDIKKTIDRTLRNFLFNNISRLTSIGVIVTLESSTYNGEFDYFKDTIVLSTEYPNVPLKVYVQMGSTANFYVKHSMVEFNDCGNYLNFTINNKSYGIKVSSSTASVFIPDIPTTLNNWVNQYNNILFGYGILVSNIRNILYFDVIQPTTVLNYSIRTAKLPTPGVDQYVITNYLNGNFGMLLSGNQIVLGATSSQDFEISGFATGMITSINNTVYPYDNQEYNIIYIDSTRIGLSYQGPFWDTYGKECSMSAFTTLAFSPLAYGVTSCPPITISFSNGQFDYSQFDAGFSIVNFNTNNYYYSDVVTKNLNSSNSNTDCILQLNIFNKIYISGDKITVLDSNKFTISKYISISYSPLTKIVYNSYNKYIYGISNNRVVVIDPINDVEINTINIGTAINDITINPNNGDVYVTTNSNVYIYYYNSFVSYDINLSLTNANKIEYNLIDKNIYIAGDKIYVISGTNRNILSSTIIPSIDNNYLYTEPINGYMYVWGDVLYKLDIDSATSSLSITNTGFNKLIYDNLNGDLILTQSNLNLSLITLDDGIVYQQTSNYGDIVISQYDSALYMATGNTVQIINPTTGLVVRTENIGFNTNKIIYNPNREALIIIGYSGEICELKATLVTSIEITPSAYSPSSISDGLFGSLSPTYIQKDNIWLKTREYIRGPRVNYSDDIQAKIVYKFINDLTPQIFMYDTSGNQLITGTSYSYIGEKPLPNPYLNRTANMDITKINDSSVQQTIFDEIIMDLDYIDSSSDISILPSPIELFLGYNDNIEGYSMNTLKMYLREDVSYTISYDELLANQISFIDMGTSSQYINGYGIIQMATMSAQSFVYNNGIKTGLKSGQIIRITVSDISNTKNKYISYNSGREFLIREIYNNQIVVDYINNSYNAIEPLVNETTIIVDYPNIGSSTYLKVNFTVIDKEIASIDLYGQTEIEDIRYKIELYNSGGHNITPNDAFIFKEYDIDEQGIDWIFLNKKRKEMLLTRSEIFPYVGSYKAIINAINYFGYNDLLLYEYYRNIDIYSPNFYKLFKVEIPDIFDNTVEGFSINDFLKHTMPNPNFEETNLFNLTYLITDKQGNNILLYSLQEVIIKLQGLKKWLQSNVIPITHKILDITGRTDVTGGIFIRHKMFSRQSFSSTEYMTPIDFNVNEAYLMPVNSGSTVYNVVIDFVISDITKLPSDFNVVIRTYKTYKEWNPFTVYNKGDEVIYYNIIYESAIDSNKILDPRKYENVSNWNLNIEYFDGQIVNYNRHIFEYIGTQSTFIEFGTQSMPTPAQTSLWLDISEWIVKDLKPVQTINEYRLIYSVTQSVVNDNILFYTSSVSKPNYIEASKPFNFTIDTNIDPFITIEVISNNGYGLVYSSRKNYEIRSSNDLFTGVQNIEPIGPFIPIIAI